MLTLNMTRGNDNNVIFLLKIFSEGNNLISNSDFSSASDWTISGDWAISVGQASYIYSANASGDLDQTIVAAETTEYVLEYTIISTAGSGFNFYLRGGAGLFAPDQIELDKTIGKHILIFTGNSGETAFGLGCGSFGAGDSIIIDDVKVRKKEDVINIATRDITLDSTTFDGKVIAWNKIGDFSQYIDAETSGGFGAATAIDFSISRYTVNSLTSDFFNEFLPAYNGGALIARTVQFGMVWNNATTLAEITWLFKGRIIDVNPIAAREMHLIVLQETEFDNTEVPYYSVQKDFNNGVSYFPDAPEDNFGVNIPVVYGDHSDLNIETAACSFVPGVIVNSATNQILFTSHQCDVFGNIVNDYVYQYNRELGVYIRLRTSTDTSTNNIIQTYYTLTPTVADIVGNFSIMFRAQSSYSDISDVENLINRTGADYIDLDSGELLALRIGGSGSTGNIGWFPSLDSLMYANWIVSSIVASDRDYALGYNNLTYGTPPNLDTETTGTLNSIAQTSIKHEFGGSTTGKKDAVLPWTSEELMNLEFYIRNDEVNPGDTIRVYYGYVFAQNIILSGITRTYKYGVIIKPRVLFPKGHEIRGVLRGGNHKRTKTWQLGVPDTGETIKNEMYDIFGNLDGREFGRWIDNVRGSARSNGYNQGDLIENPIYIIESLFRDEKFVERNLQITSSSAVNVAVVQELKVKIINYYDYAEWFNATTLHRSWVNLYVGSTATVTIQDNDASMAADDNIYLTNIYGDYKIDETTFDVIGNITDGLRDDWKFGKSINAKQSFQDIIDELLFESHCILFESADEDNGYSKIKVKALDSGSGDTWSKPAYADGLPLVELTFTDLGQVYTSYKLFYYYDVGKGDYLKSILVDKRGYSNPSGGSTLTDEHKNLCSHTEKTFNLINPFTYSSNWIYDDATAEKFLDKKIHWFTKQRVKISWTTPLCDNINDIDYLKYELGDQVKLNFSSMIPEGINNSSYFMIQGKIIIVNPQGTPYIIFELIEL